MIAATPNPSWDSLAAALATLAGKIAQESQPEETESWRDPAALWPDFDAAKG